MEHWFHLRLQGHDRRRLRHPVSDIGYAENPYASLFLGYFHSPDRPGKIRPRRHAVPQPVEVVFQFLLVLLDRHAVGPGRPAVLLHLQPRIPQQLLGDDLRLALQLRFMHAVPPFRLTSSASLDSPAPWLHPHYQVSQLIPVGTALTGGPPDRSHRAGLPQWAPALGSGGK